MTRKFVAKDVAPISLVVSCEHGGNRIPTDYQGLFSDHQALLQSHRGYDPGALIMARSLTDAFEATLMASVVSRLLVDLNRSVGHRQLHMASIPRRPADVRGTILKRFYTPYRIQMETLVNRAIASHGRVIHISVHSFTPTLNGQERLADIGLLYDPSRPGERALCQSWQSSLTRCAPNLKVRRNYPYAGRNDGLTRWFRQHRTPAEYIGIELELNQRHSAAPPERWFALRTVIIRCLREALSPDTPKTMAALTGRHEPCNNSPLRRNQA